MSFILTSIRPHVAAVPIRGVIDGIDTANFIGYNEYKIGCYIEGRFRQILHINDNQVIFDHTHILDDEAHHLFRILEQVRAFDIESKREQVKVNWFQDGF